MSMFSKIISRNMWADYVIEQESNFVKNCRRKLDERWDFVQLIFNSCPMQSSKLTSDRWSFSPLRLLLFTSLFFGAKCQRPGPFPAQFELSSLDGTNGFVLNGVDTGDKSGASVASAGDINDDGISDILIGAYHADIDDNIVNVGKTYVIFGGLNIGRGGTFELSSLNGKNGFVIIGDKVNENSGWSVSSAGDVNNDGVADFLIGALHSNPAPNNSNAGKTYVVFGGKTLGSNGILNLKNINNIGGFVINGEKSGDKSGYSVSSAGDFNGDGVVDLLIGAPFANVPPEKGNAGKTYIVFGRADIGKGDGKEWLMYLNETSGCKIVGEKTNDLSGFSVSGAGDFNGDGISDILIGAPRAASLNGRSRAGRAYIVFGNKEIEKKGDIELGNLNKSAGLILYGYRWSDNSGNSISWGGDINDDGLDDILVGSFLANPTKGRENGGRTYAVFGSRDLQDKGAIELSKLNSTSGLIFLGEKKNEQSGFSVSSAGDVNGDGISDILIGANKANSTKGFIEVGKTYLVFGAKGLGQSGRFELSSLNGTNGFVLMGQRGGDQSGYSVANAGDVNGDGADDFLIGAYLANPTSNRWDAGKTYVIFGRKITRYNASFTNLPAASSLTTIINSFTNEFTPSNYKLESSNSQSIILPIVLTVSGIVFVSGICATLYFFKNRGEKNRKEDHELAPIKADPFTANTDNIYDIIQVAPLYDVGELYSADEEDKYHE